MCHNGGAVAYSKRGNEFHMTIGQKLLAVILAFLALGVVLSTVAQQLYAERVLSQPRPLVQLEQLRFSNGRVLAVEVMRTPEQIAQGLSGRDQMAPAQGMLFLLPSKQQPSFWMKEMRFALDLIWLDNGKIVEVIPNVPPPTPGTPDSELPKYTPSVPVTAVLEVPAGTAGELGLFPPLRAELVEQ